MMNSYTCCFFGHRVVINENEKLRKELFATIEELIVSKKTDTFLFGSKSNFDDLCYELVTQLKQKYPHIKRVYVRAEFPYINDSYKEYLLESYEDTYYPESIRGSNKSVYIKRNFEMIDNSYFCVAYYCEKYKPKKRKSGTEITLNYALKKNKEIILFPNKN